MQRSTMGTKRTRNIDLARERRKVLRKHALRADTANVISFRPFSAKFSLVGHPCPVGQMKGRIPSCERRREGGQRVRQREIYYTTTVLAPRPFRSKWTLVRERREFARWRMERSTCLL